MNTEYRSGAIQNLGLGLPAGTFQLQFNGVTDLPYAILGSPDLVNWSQIGIAAQPSPGFFQFNDPVATNNAARFYEVAIP